MSAKLIKAYKESSQRVKEELSFKSIMQVPKIEKVILSMGAGSVFSDSAKMEQAQDALTKIAGQKACLRSAKKSVAGFKVREGMKTGIMVTLRGERKWSFLDRLRNIALPRDRDFRGFKDKSFNGRAFSFGVKDYTIFPEVRELMKNYDILGMNITIVASNAHKEAFKGVLLGIGFPFKENS